MVIEDTPMMRVFYKLDHTFDSPKVNPLPPSLVWSCIALVVLLVGMAVVGLEPRVVHRSHCYSL